MHATGVHNGVLLYIDKTTLESKVFTIPYDAVKAADIIIRFKTLHTTLTNGILPVAEAKQSYESSWLCRYCEYKDKCDTNRI
jgi:CRISPR/Cas system-associated exonuclease Cas4 (RecB family)